MMLKVIFPLLLLLMTATASSLHPDHRTVARTLSTRQEGQDDQEGPEPCQYNESIFQIDEQYDGIRCPGNIQGSNNNCQVVFTDYTNTTCNAWCQGRTRFFYGTERPFVNPGYFVGPGDASITPLHHMIYRDVSKKITWDNYDVIHAGTAGGNEVVGYGIGKASEMTLTLRDGQCGYYSFVPILREVCGTRTWGWNCSDPHNVHNDLNICSTSLQRHLDPEADSDGTESWPGLPQLTGETIFIETNCSTHMPLLKEQQEQTNITGQVALPNDVYKTMAQHWKRQAGLENKTEDETEVDTPEPDCDWSRGVAYAKSCLGVISYVATTANLTGPAVYGNATNHTSIFRDRDAGCAITLYQDERWTLATCKDNISYQEVYAAVQNIVDKCTYENNWVHGIQKIRELGDCGSSIGIGRQNSHFGPSYGGLLVSL